MKATFKNKEVYYELEFGRHSACDTFICVAYYADNEESLTGGEMNDLEQQEQDKICVADMEKYGYFRD